MSIATRLRLTLALGSLLAAPLAALAQGPGGGERRFGPPPGMAFGERGGPGEGQVVKGAPFKATALSESTQALADGNTIVHKDSALTYRDADGRTRREVTLPARGPEGAAARTLVIVSDPVAGSGFVLEPDTRTARQRPSFGGRPRGEGPPSEARGPGEGQGPEGAPPDLERPRPDGPGGFRERGGMPAPPEAAAPAQETALGTRTIEGLEATGTRRTVTIPAGAIGNTRPIQIVSERWYSADLKTVLMSTEKDPRFGTHTFRLTGIARGDVDKALFEVPADYTLREGPPRMGGPGHPGQRPGPGPEGEKR